MRTAPPTVPGIAQPNSTPDSPQSRRPPDHHGQRRAAAAHDGVAVAVDRGQLAGQPQHQPVEAGVGGQQVRAQADHRHLDALRPPPAQQARAAARVVLRPANQAAGAARAHRRQPRDRDVALDDTAAPPSHLLQQQVAHPAHVAGAHRQHQVAVAERLAQVAAAVVQGALVGQRHARPRSLTASTTSLAVTPRQRLLAGRVDLGHHHLVGRRQRRAEVERQRLRCASTGAAGNTPPRAAAPRCGRPRSSPPPRSGGARSRRRSRCRHARRAARSGGRRP